MDYQEPVTALKAVYQEYLNSYEEFMAESGTISIFKKILVGSSSDVRADKAFLRGTEQAVADLCALPEDRRCEEVGKAARFMLLEATGVDQTSNLMFIGAHSKALPLIELLASADAKEILGAYLELYPKKQQLPAQEKVLKALKARGK